VTRTEPGYKQIFPLQFSDGSRVDARVRWNEGGVATLVTPDADRAFRSSQWVLLDTQKVGLKGAGDAWRRLMSCMGEPAKPSAHPRVAGDGWILVDGPIGAGWAQRQIHRLAAAEPLYGVVLASEGGLVGEAIQLARWIRQQRLATAVEGECASACVLAFSGGTERYLGPAARLGLHQFSTTERGSFSGGQRVTAEIAAFFEEMGVDNDVALLGAKTSPTDIRWLTTEEALDYKLASKAPDAAPTWR